MECRFFKLPTELRHQVYSYLIPPAPISSRQSILVTKAPAYPPDPHVWPAPARPLRQFLVCRFLYYDAAAFFFATNHVTLHEDQAWRFLTTTGARHGPEMAGLRLRVAVRSATAPWVRHQGPAWDRILAALVRSGPRADIEVEWVDDRLSFVPPFERCFRFKFRDFFSRVGGVEGLQRVVVCSSGEKEYPHEFIDAVARHLGTGVSVQAVREKREDGSEKEVQVYREVMMAGTELKVMEEAGRMSLLACS